MGVWWLGNPVPVPKHKWAVCHDGIFDFNKEVLRGSHQPVVVFIGRR